MLPSVVRQKIAHTYGVTDKTFVQWLTLIKNLRNKCAHHERLIFSRFASVGLKRYCDSSKNPKLIALEDAVRDENDSTGASLYFLVCIMVHLLNVIRPESQWKYRLRDFILDPEFADCRKSIGAFATDTWHRKPLWN